MNKRCFTLAVNLVALQSKENTIKHLVKVKDKKWLSVQGRAKLA
jgi:hypothetical protein